MAGRSFMGPPAYTKFASSGNDGRAKFESAEVRFDGVETASERVLGSSFKSIDRVRRRRGEHRVKRLLRNRTARGVLVGLVCSAICWSLNSSSAVRNAEDRALDSCFLVRGERPTEAPLVVIGLDEPMLRQLDKPVMYLSPELGEVLTYLGEQGAAAVGVDFFVPENSRSKELDEGGIGEAVFVSEAISSFRRVVLPKWMLSSDKVLMPIYEWTLASQFPVEGDGPSMQWAEMAAVNADVDGDSFWRRQRLMFSDSDGAVHPAMALSVYAMATERDTKWFGELAGSIGRDDRGGPQIDGTPVPLDKRQKLLINYVGPSGTVPHESFGQVLAAARGESRGSRNWKGAIVLIGFTDPTQRDLHATPYSNQSAARMITKLGLDRSARLMPGVEVHANLVATLYDRAFITTPWWVSTPLMLVLMGAVLGVVLERTSLEWGLLVVIGHQVGWRLACIGVFCATGWRVEMTAMSGMGVLLYAATFAMRWRWIRQMMGMVKSEAIARALVADPSKLDLKGENREMTVLFADVRNFTTFSEEHAPQEVVALLNAYFGVVVPTIESNRGVLNTYLGDGVMVIYGAPESNPDHAEDAVVSAIEMVRQVHENTETWRRLGSDDFRIGVGIHTGHAVVGTIGSPRRLDYTAIGDTVNSAARIEAANKEVGSEILVSQATYDALSDEARDRLAGRWESRELMVKGKQEPLVVYPIDPDDTGHVDGPEQDSGNGSTGPAGGESSVGSEQ